MPMQSACFRISNRHPNIPNMTTGRLYESLYQILGNSIIFLTSSSVWRIMASPEQVPSSFRAAFDARRNHWEKCRMSLKWTRNRDCVSSLMPKQVLVKHRYTTYKQYHVVMHSQETQTASNPIRLWASGYQASVNICLWKCELHRKPRQITWHVKWG